MIIQNFLSSYWNTLCFHQYSSSLSTFKDYIYLIVFNIRTVKYKNHQRTGQNIYLKSKKNNLLKQPNSWNVDTRLMRITTLRQVRESVNHVFSFINHTCLRLSYGIYTVSCVVWGMYEWMMWLYMCHNDWKKNLRLKPTQYL